ncbi:uncharacterized protein LOC103096258 isoform X1 [Monodelphis domestica]|uniref:uncharacterized protein LOC103096258 isoform X1 n=1 Tax=Monodelphis domestica TaxID=13616 RepID=UPI0024E1CAEE|nr:uncharacterized protein LOC103096258 isoform X1 [Monodelphis domestica]
MISFLSFYVPKDSPSSAASPEAKKRSSKKSPKRQDGEKMVQGHPVQGRHPEGAALGQALGPKPSSLPLPRETSSTPNAGTCPNAELFAIKSCSKSSFLWLKGMREMSSSALLSGKLKGLEAALVVCQKAHLNPYGAIQATGHKYANADREEATVSSSKTLQKGAPFSAQVEILSHLWGMGSPLPPGCIPAPVTLQDPWRSL